MKLAELTFFLQKAMPKRLWNRVFCSHKLNALCAVLLKKNFARASSYVLDNNLANYLVFLLYACPSSLSRLNTSDFLFSVLLLLITRVSIPASFQDSRSI